MAYTPPTKTAVDFALVAYTPPTKTAVNFEFGTVVSTGYIKWYNGATWVLKPVKYWTGAAWVQKPLKHWTGSAWV